MDEDVTTNQTKWRLVEVEGSLEKFPCTNPCIESGLTEKIEGELSLWEKKVPKVRWKGKVMLAKWSLNVQIARSARFGNACPVGQVGVLHST